MKKALKIFGIILLSLVTLLGIVAFLLNTYSFQNFLTKQVTQYLSKKLQTRVEIRNVRLDLFYKVNISGIYIEDRAKDTLLYAGLIKLDAGNVFSDYRVIRNITLEDAFVNINRKATGKAWNYDFIVDAFAGNSQPKKKKNSGGSFALDLKQAHFKNVHVRQLDRWVGSDMEYHLNTLDLDAKKVDLVKKNITLNKLAIDGANIILRDYTGGRPDSLKPKPNATDTNIIRFNPAGWKIALEELQLRNSRFELSDPETEATPNYFDAKNILVTQINGTLKNARLDGDTIKTTIVKLTAKERCGLEITDFHTDAEVSHVGVICKNLLLQTRRSEIRDFYAMRYNRFGDFLDYINNVVMEGNFNNSFVSSDDVAYFAEPLQSWKMRVKANGKVKGTVANLRAQDLYVDNGITKFLGDFTMRGLPDIDSTFMDVRPKMMITSGTDLNRFAPTLDDISGVNLKALNAISFKGAFTGFINDFVAYGDFNTNLGFAHTDINMKLPIQGIATYSGKVETRDFDIGTLLYQQDLLGKASVIGAVKGQGFTLKTLKIEIDAVVKQVEVNGYNYHNLDAKGAVAKGIFDGKFNAADPNLTLQTNGRIDFSGSVPRFNIVGNVDTIDLKALKLTDPHIYGKARFRTAFTANNIDNFLGQASLYEIDMHKDSLRLDLDSLILVSTMNGNEKVLSLISDNVAAEIKGEFSILSLPGSVQHFMSRYLPEYIKAPSGSFQNDFTFTIHLQHVSNLLNSFVPYLKGFDETEITGSLNNRNQQLSFNATIPEFTYNNNTVNTTTLVANGNNEKLDLVLKTGEVIQNDDLLIPELVFSSSLSNNRANFSLNTSSTTTLSQATVNGYAEAINDSLRLYFNPSTINFNEKTWQIPSGNKIVFSKGYIAVQNFEIGSGSQKIKVSSPYPLNPKQRVEITLQQIDLEQLAILSGITSPRIIGFANGTATIDSVWGGQFIETDLSIDNLVLNNDTVGKVVAKATYDVTASELRLYNGSGIINQNNNLLAQGTFNFSGSSDKLDGSLQFQDTKLNFLQSFMTGVVSDLKGTATGKLYLKGSSKTPLINGEVQLQNAGFKIDYLGVPYTIQPTNVNFTPDKISFDQLVLVDPNKHEANVKGIITHHNLDHWYFDLSLTGREFLIMNTTSADNDLFYGYIVADATATIKGNLDGMVINVSRAVPSPNTRINVGLPGSGDLGSYDFVTFRTFDQQQKEHKKSRFDLTLRINADINENATTSIIIDPSTNSGITATGTGKLTIDFPLDGEMKMNGNIDISQGVYDYKFANSLVFIPIERKFTIDKGSRVIFEGDPSNALLDVKAIYKVEGGAVPMTLLTPQEQTQMESSSSNDEYREMKRRQPTFVYLSMKGHLANPTLKFDIQMPDYKAYGDLASQKLRRLRDDDAEMLVQVGSLLIFNSFYTQNNTGLGGELGQAGVTMVTNMLSSTVSSQLTNLIGNRLLNDKSLNLNVQYNRVNYTTGGISTGNMVRNEFQFGVSKNFFDNRLIVDVGTGGIDFNENRSIGNARYNSIPGDYRIQYLLTEDGRYRTNLFRSTNYDAIDGRMYKLGVGIGYRKNFNEFKELVPFLNKRKTQPKDTTGKR